MVVGITQNVKKREKKGVNPNSLKNLRPNLKGRPTKEHSVTEALRELAPEILEITIGGKKNTTRTAVQLMALGMYLKAIKGDASMAREIIDRLEGKVAQPLSGANGEPLSLNIIVKTKEDKDALEQASKRLG